MCIRDRSVSACLRAWMVGAWVSLRGTMPKCCVEARNQRIGAAVHQSAVLPTVVCRGGVTVF
eukprot:3832632-Amphidinium_carterae.2